MSNETKAVVSAPLNPLVGQIIFCYGNHTAKTFTDKMSAIDYIKDLWDQEDQCRLINLEMVIVKQRGYEDMTIHRGKNSNARFTGLIEGVIGGMPCPGCDYHTCDCGLGLPLPNTVSPSPATADPDLAVASIPLPPDSGARDEPTIAKDLKNLL